MNPVTFFFIAVVIFTSYGPFPKMSEVTDQETCMKLEQTASDLVGKKITLTNSQTGESEEVPILDAQARCIVVTKQEHA